MVNRVTQPCESPLIVFAGGGTGGHLFPALAIAGALRSKLPDARFVFFATQRSIDARILSRNGCDLVQQTLPTIHRAPWRWIQMYLGFRRSARLKVNIFYIVK